MGSTPRATRYSRAIAVVLLFSGCGDASISAPSTIAGDSFDTYGPGALPMHGSWSTGLVLQPSTYDGSRNMVHVALGPSFTFGKGFVGDQRTARRVFGIADGLKANTTYDVSIAYRIEARHAGSYPQDSRSISGFVANGMPVMVQYDGVTDTGSLGWRRLSTMITTDSNGTLNVEFGLFLNSGFFSYVFFDDLRIQ
jgi:hypothetical protein